MSDTVTREPCCPMDWGGSHYHCPACGRVSSMYGCVSGTPPRRRCTDTELPDDFGGLMSVTGPFDGDPPWGASRHLARSVDGRVIHRVDCRYARVPWPGADTVSDDELLGYKLRLGYKVCKVCQPSFRRPEVVG